MYWTHLYRYEVEGCPQKFLWHHGWGGIDLGRGPGKSKPKPARKSRHHAVMGIVIQAVIEDLYNHELWRREGSVDPKEHGKLLALRLQRMTEAALVKEVANNYIDWRESPGMADLEKTCVDGVLGYLKTMAHHKLLGPYARAEVDLLGHIDQYNAVGGIADTIIRRDDTGVTILDGKNSTTKLKYVDPDQLRWYALCFYLAYGKLPDRLGFVWYRYPYEEASGESGVDWVEFTERDIQSLAARARDTRLKMSKELFPAVPSSNACKWCDYETVCPERMAQKVTRAKDKSLPIIDEAGGGFVEFNMGSEGAAQTPPKRSND